MLEPSRRQAPGGEEGGLWGVVCCWGPHYPTLLGPPLGECATYADCMSLSPCQGIMLVYDITNEKSFDNIQNWIRNIEEVRISAPATLGTSHVPSPQSSPRSSQVYR